MTNFFGKTNKAAYATIAAIALSFVLMGSVVAYAGVSSASAGDKSESLKSEIENGYAKNVIFLLGDGMGDSEITIARNYEVGAAGRLNMDALPLTGATTTYSVQEADPSLPDYVTDSAAAATAWATGVKTSNGRISTTAGTDQDLKTIIEMAQENGLMTGLVSTAEITDATPAALASHVSSRGCQGPANMGSCPQDDKVAGGPGSIAEQLVDHRVNVILGGGKQRFDQTITAGPDAGKTVLQSATDQGYAFVANANDLQGASDTKMVLGLFSSGNMALEWNGLAAQSYPGSGPQVCQEDQRPADQPSLEAMTTKAINILNKQSKGKGFFLQVEGASIDKRDHASNPCQQIGETIAFDKAVKAAMDFANKDKNTLVIVTADHAHTSQIIPMPTNTAQPGAFSTLITYDGTEMTVSYATAPVGTSQEHTGAQVHVAAMGPRAGEIVGLTDHTDLFHIMASALGL